MNSQIMRSISDENRSNILGGRGGALLGDGPPTGAQGGGFDGPDRWDDGPSRGDNFNNEPAFFNEPNQGGFNNRGGSE
mgnify:CR=1 FL=1